MAVRFVLNTVFVWILTFLAVRVADAITTSGDPNDAKWSIEYDEAPFYVSLSSRGACAGSIVSKRHVVTAAHCLCNLDGAPATILSSGATVKPVKAWRNPECCFSCVDDGPNRCDVAVLSFAENLTDDDDVPLSPYQWDDEAGKTIVLYGNGLSGNAGDSSSCRSTDDAKFRRAENVVTSASSGILRYAMDENGGLDLEGIAQDGDSGGPAVIVRDSVKYLAGANSGTSESVPCDYGSVDQYARVSEHYNFVTNLTQGNADEPCVWYDWSTKTSTDTFVSMLSKYLSNCEQGDNDVTGGNCCQE